MCLEFCTQRFFLQPISFLGFFDIIFLCSRHCSECRPTDQLLSSLVCPLSAKLWFSRMCKDDDDIGLHSRAKFSHRAHPPLIPRWQLMGKKSSSNMSKNLKENVQKCMSSSFCSNFHETKSIHYKPGNRCERLLHLFPARRTWARRPPSSLS